MGASKLSYKLKLNPLTIDNISFIQACLLGDGSLMQSGKHYRLRIAHKQAHSEYVNWKYQQLKNLCVSIPTVDRTNNSLRFGTVGHPDISEIRELWYRPTKEIPCNFLLDARTLAIWFMDDGGRTRNTVNFSVHSFSVDSINYLQTLLVQLGIFSSIHSDGKGPRLYIKQPSYQIFKELVKPFILGCMAYKLP